LDQNAGFNTLMSITVQSQRFIAGLNNILHVMMIAYFFKTIVHVFTLISINLLRDTRHA